MISLAVKSQQHYRANDAAPAAPESDMHSHYVFPKLTPKAIICAFPQGGHLTGNNWVFVAQRSRLPI